jgi:hypothetical protein
MIEKDRKSKDFVEYVIPKPMTDKQREQFLNSIFSKAQ